ncbi:hypothetical protein HYFRA_00001460 [Hymenoscyphus fraxineus]|uniref:Uncharacterized protein n=1 Tax=Hymenoscyphus fraxineus TaxID=746836 RepID=A0A9N9L5N8_9HELO|nr:hypothetical protein HYFRA_00001460 [Hymenoscyphus fraxineus]
MSSPNILQTSTIMGAPPVMVEQPNAEKATQQSSSGSTPATNSPNTFLKIIDMSPKDSIKSSNTKTTGDHNTSTAGNGNYSAVMALLEKSGYGSATSKAISNASNEDRVGYTKVVKEDKDTSDITGKLGTMGV